MSRNQRVLCAMIIMLCKIKNITEKKQQKIYGEVLLECVGSVKKVGVEKFWGGT